MSYQRRMTRPDSTQTEIVDALRKAGVSVWIIGQPCDLLTHYHGRWQVMECKPLAKRARKDQDEQSQFLAAYAVPIVRTPLQAIEALTGSRS